METKEKTTSLSALRAPQEKYSVGMTDSLGFELAQRAARLLAASSLVPKNYQNSIADCVIALNMAYRVGADPLMVMQNLVIVHGRPTWSSQFLISTVNTCGRFSALRYEFFGEKDKDDWGCRAWAIEKATGEKLVGTDITIKLAKDEGWYGRSGSKWKTMPQQMLMYRAGSWWARAYAPELSMGLQTAEEMHDVIDLNPNDSFTVDGNTFTTDELRRPSQTAEVIDQDTGEVMPPPPAPAPEIPEAPQEQANLIDEPVYTFAQVNDMLVKSKSIQDLDEAADLIRYVANEQHQDELRKVYQSLRNPKD
jgi:hypothetical protein